MIRRFTAVASRAALVALLGLGATAVTASAQQAQSTSVAAAQVVDAGPRVREMPRAEARFKDSAAPRYKDRTTTVTISTVVLVLALVILVLVLI